MQQYRTIKKEMLITEFLAISITIQEGVL